MSQYPETARDDIVEILHGIEVPDPYRWLEDADSANTIAWGKAQDVLCREALDSHAGRVQLAADLARRMPGTVSAPAIRGDQQFFHRREQGQDHAVFYRRTGAGPDKVLIDPNALSADGLVTLDSVAVSPRGALVAYQLSEGGDEQSVLRVLDVETGAVLDGPIDRCRYSPVAWEPDDSGFYYVRELGYAGDAHLARRIYHHVLGADPDTDTLVWGADSELGSYFDVDLSEDGRWLLVSSSVGTAPRNDLWIADRTADSSFVLIHGHDVDATSSAHIGYDGRLWIHTNLGAPRKRLVVCDPVAPTPDRWVDVVAEDPDGAVLDDVTLTRGHVVAAWTRDVVGEISVHEVDGSRQSAIDLPGLGSIGIVGRRDGAPEIYIGYTDWLTPPVVLHHDLTTGTTTEWATAPGAVPVEGVEARQIFVDSTNGARVPMFVIAATNHDGGPRPTILYGYGGFNISLSPAYSTATATWVAAGGIYVVANLRGGGEYGEAWHRDGMRGVKQHVFDDLHACAERLVADGVTTSAQLAIQGGSNGGLLVGAGLTQRPDLYRAVVCSAPLLDMIRYERFGLGQTWNDEYGRVEDPEEFAWLVGYSPYHRVVAGTEYPAVLFTLFANDTRVDPLHGRKLAAHLQWATTGDRSDRPILVRTEGEVGHGARSVSRTIDMAVDVLSFIARHTGLRVD